MKRWTCDTHHCTVFSSRVFRPNTLFFQPSRIISCSSSLSSGESDAARSRFMCRIQPCFPLERSLRCATTIRTNFDCRTGNSRRRHHVEMIDSSIHPVVQSPGGLRKASTGTLKDGCRSNSIPKPPRCCHSDHTVSNTLNPES